jgi:hypothetical protein
MRGLCLEAAGEERVRLKGIDWAIGACLTEVPKLLPQMRSGAAGDRLFPTPSQTDAKLNEDWGQFVVPELEKLFASAGEIMAKDVEHLGEQSELVFPMAHCDAWMCAINQVRLGLGAQYNVLETDMDDMKSFDPNDGKHQAILRIHILGYVLEVFVAFLSSEPPD